MCTGLFCHSREGAEKVPWQPLLLGTTMCCKGKTRPNVHSALRVEGVSWAVTPHSRKLSLSTTLKVSRDIEEERREPCFKVDWPHLLMHHLRFSLPHGGDFSPIKLRRQTLHPRLGVRRVPSRSCMG